MVDQPPDPTPPSAETLGRSYKEMLGRQQWQLDVGETWPMTDEASESSAPPTVPPPALRIVEALLFVGGAPLTAEQAAQSIRGLTAAQFTEIIDLLNRDYRRQGRPYAIQAQGVGFVLTLRPRFRPVLDRLYGTTREARLSPAAVDVLALVAYRQPATKQEIDSLRGADSGALLRQLVRRGLVAVVQRGESGQREVSYGTTARFLQLFGLSSPDDLPQTQDLQRL
jgi:segregation and condensation protein B